jgi:hypothetical protein
MVGFVHKKKAKNAKNATFFSGQKSTQQQNTTTNHFAIIAMNDDDDDEKKMPPKKKKDDDKKKMPPKKKKRPPSEVRAAKVAHCANMTRGRAVYRATAPSPPSVARVDEAASPPPPPPPPPLALVITRIEHSRMGESSMIRRAASQSHTITALMETQAALIENQTAFTAAHVELQRQNAEAEGAFLDTLLPNNQEESNDQEESQEDQEDSEPTNAPSRKRRRVN